MQRCKHRGSFQRRDLRKLHDLCRDSLLGKQLRRLQDIVDDDAIGQQCQVAAFAQNRDRFERARLICALSAARIAHGDRSLQLRDCLAQHGAQLGKARRAEDAHIRHGAQITDIKAAVVRITVVADDTGAVNAKHKVQPL